jgi:hypothetical protein
MAIDTLKERSLALLDWHLREAHDAARTHAADLASGMMPDQIR